MRKEKSSQLPVSISEGKRANNGVRFGVAIPSALLAVTLVRSGVSSTLPHAGVPAEGELARKRGLAGGAAGTDRSVLSSPISISSSSEDGKSSGGDEDMVDVSTDLIRKWRRVTC
jgi:hypothetical protein